MIKLNVKDVEKSLGQKLNNKIISVGVDTASRAGICSASVNKDTLYLDTQFIQIDSKDIYFKYNQLIKSFKSIFAVNNPQDYKVVIEDTFFGKNVNVLKMISRMGMIVYMCAVEAGIQDIIFIYPTTSRKNLGIKGNSKKADVHKALSDMLKLELTDADISDAIILSINGLLKQQTGI